MSDCKSCNTCTCVERNAEDVDPVDPESMSANELLIAINLIAVVLGPAGPPDLCYDAKARRALKDQQEDLTVLYQKKVLN